LASFGKFQLGRKVETTNEDWETKEGDGQRACHQGPAVLLNEDVGLFQRRDIGLPSR